MIKNSAVRLLGDSLSLGVFRFRHKFKIGPKLFRAGGRFFFFGIYYNPKRASVTADPNPSHLTECLAPPVGYLLWI